MPNALDRSNTFNKKYNNIDPDTLRFEKCNCPDCCFIIGSGAPDGLPSNVYFYLDRDTGEFYSKKVGVWAVDFTAGASGGGNGIYGGSDNLSVDTNIGLLGFDLSTSGTGNIDLKNNHTTDLVTSFTSNSDVLDTVGAFSVGVKGAGIIYTRPSNNVTGRIFAGDDSAFGGTGDHVQMGVGALSGSTSESQIAASIDTSTGGADISLKSTPIGTGVSNINIISNGSTTQDGVIKLTVDDAGNSNTYSLQLNPTGLYFSDFTAGTNWRLPWAAGNDGDILVLNGSNQASWQAPSGGGGNGIYDGGGNLVINTSVNSSGFNFELTNSPSILLDSNNLLSLKAVNAVDIGRNTATSTITASTLSLDIGSNSGANGYVLTADGTSLSTWEINPTLANANQDLTGNRIVQGFSNNLNFAGIGLLNFDAANLSTLSGFSTSITSNGTILLDGATSVNVQSAGDITFNGSIKITDSNASVGTAGQVFTSDGTEGTWENSTVSNLFNSTLVLDQTRQQDLNGFNFTFDGGNNFVFRNLVRFDVNNVATVDINSDGDLLLEGTLKFTDGNSSVGTANQVLTSNGVSSTWENPTKVNLAITAVAAGNYTVLLTDDVIQKSGITGGGDTITLPSGAATGQIFTIKDASGTASSNNIIVDTAGAELIDGSATITLTQNYQSKEIYFDGTNYFVL